MAVASLDEIESDFDDVQDSEDERMMQSYRFFLDNEVLFSVLTALANTIIADSGGVCRQMRIEVMKAAAKKENYGALMHLAACDFVKVYHIATWYQATCANVL